jgi:phosphate starvation-inducible PhoH-like protein
MQLSLDINNKQLSNLCGVLNANIIHLENSLGVEINNIGADFILKGNNIETTAKILMRLSKLSKEITPADINFEVKHFNIDTTNHKIIKLPKKQLNINNSSQLSYIDKIDKFDCVFAIGAAGTGKTYLAVAKAVKSLIAGDVERIILVRPAVEAGESLGFLPGDMAEKIDPYLTPIYDALYDFIGVETTAKMLENKTIEIAPLAFMRGRTLNSAFIILDESQNTSKAQMKMFLTRLGFNSKMVITGDNSQIDLKDKRDSGLLDAMKVLGSVKAIAWNYFTASDVLRHSLVGKIIKAYENK